MENHLEMIIFACYQKIMLAKQLSNKCKTYRPLPLLSGSSSLTAGVFSQLQSNKEFSISETKWPC